MLESGSSCKESVSQSDQIANTSPGPQVSWHLDSSNLKLGSWVPDWTSRQIFFCPQSALWLFPSAFSLSYRARHPAQQSSADPAIFKKKKECQKPQLRIPTPGLTWPRRANQRKTGDGTVHSRPQAPERGRSSLSDPHTMREGNVSTALPLSWLSPEKQHSLKEFKGKERGKRKGSRRKNKPWA